MTDFGIPVICAVAGAFFGVALGKLHSLPANAPGQVGLNEKVDLNREGEP